MKGSFDIVIVGMGPAGLASALRLVDSGYKIGIIDSGKSVYTRDRYAPEDATIGHGGAGLFSDGKFSFFPSASELWSLPQTTSLKAAYNWTCKTLQRAGLDTPPFPEDPKAYSGGADAMDWFLKAYPSDYLSLDARLRLVSDMVSAIDGKIFDECEVKNLTYNHTVDSFAIEAKHQTTGVTEFITARRVILTTGRFGPLSKILKNLTAHHAFRRLELGFRIEQASEKAFFRDMKQLDPKLCIQSLDGSVEWRTFCVCRQGETCFTKTGDLWTVSGRSDCPRTGRSNSGFNTRILESSQDTNVIKGILDAMKKESSYFQLPMIGLLDGDADVVSRIDNIYGTEVRKYMAEGLQHLARAFPELASDTDAKLIGPTFEGVGSYPKVDGGMRLLDVPAWIAGDACGLFRGIVAAMISGHYAASSVLQELER